jgi:hypothetical protein
MPRAVTLVTCAAILAASLVLAPLWLRATLPGASCGSFTNQDVYAVPDPRASADTAVLTCFNTAARACKPAGVHELDIGADTFTNSVYTIGPAAHGCEVTDHWQERFASGGGYTTGVKTASCRMTAVTRAAVWLNCGGQHVVIPAQVRTRAAG